MLLGRTGSDSRVSAVNRLKSTTRGLTLNGSKRVRGRLPRVSQGQAVNRLKSTLLRGLPLGNPKRGNKQMRKRKGQSTLEGITMHMRWARQQLGDPRVDIFPGLVCLHFTRRVPEASWTRLKIRLVDLTARSTVKNNDAIIIYEFESVPVQFDSND